MLFIVELLFLGAGLWTIISGTLPAGLFKILFGRGEYRLPTDQARLFGLLLASPLPLAFFVSFLLAAVLGSRGINLGIGFELVYILVVIIAAIMISRRAKLPEAQSSMNSSAETSVGPTAERSYGMRLLIIFGIVVLLCVTSVSFFSLVIVAVSTITVGTRWTGDFWQDEFPIILTIAIVALGSFGIYKLVQAMRK